MGIKIEFNPDIALRDISEFKAGRRKEAECLPENIESGETYDFLKEGQRNYWLNGEIALLETKGNEQLSDPLASIIVKEATHFRENGKTFTKGKYHVVEVFNDNKVHFNWLNRTKEGY